MWAKMVASTVQPFVSKFSERLPVLPVFAIGELRPMRLFPFPIAILVCLLSVAAAAAQGRVPATPSRTDQSVASVSPAQAAIDRAAAANKYVFLFFWKEKGPATDKAWAVFQPAMAKMADTAQAVSIRVTDPAEKKLVDKYAVSHAPMPLVLAIAPCGAITKAFATTFDEKELRTAFVSPCTQRCLQALQSRKLVFVCLVDQANLQDKMPVPKGVEDFKADKKYGAATEIIMVNVRDAMEGTFLKGLGLGAHDAPMTMFLAPPGAVIGTFTRRASKEMFTAQLVAAQSGCGAGCSCHH
jgi:hypothetical protein